MTRPSGRKTHKRTREYCEQVARTCKTMKEFWTKCRSAATKAQMEGWIDSYDWLLRERCKRNSLDEKECRRIAKQYETLRDFRMHDTSAYVISTRNGWLKSFTWLKRELDVKHVRTLEEVTNLAKRFKTLKDFRESYFNEYRYAWQHGWLENFTWLTRAK